MKKYLKYLILTLLLIVTLSSREAFSATTPVKPVGSDYANNSANKNFNDTGRSNADSKLTKGSDGNYTEASIRSYQASQGLKVDGKLGVETANALNKTSTSNPSGNTDGSADAKTGDPTSTTTALDGNTSDDTNNLLGVSTSKLRKGDVDAQTIVDAILNIISFLLSIAGTVSIFSLIYYSVKMQLNSGITGDSSGVESAKKGMIGSLIGFVIAISAWFLVTRAIQLLVELS